MAEIQYFGILHDWILFSQKDTASVIEENVMRIEKRYSLQREQLLVIDNDANTIAWLRLIGVPTVHVQRHHSVGQDGGLPITQ